MVKVRVLLVDDDALVRAGLRMILSSSEEMEVVGEAADGADAVAAVRAHRPDVVLMDIRMPGMDGIAATSALRRLAAPPQTPIYIPPFSTKLRIFALPLPFNLRQ